MTDEHSSSGAGEPDRQLVTRMQSGDADAIGQLYDRHGGLAYSIAFSILSNSADAEDAVAAAFAQIWQRSGSYNPNRGSLGAWVATIARSRALDLLRSRGRRAAALRGFAHDVAEAAGAQPAALDDLETGFHKAQMRHLVRGSLAALPLEQRQVLELAYFRGLSHREIAERLQDPLGTVKTRIRSGLQKLREGLRAAMETVQ